MSAEQAEAHSVPDAEQPESLADASTPSNRQVKVVGGVKNKKEFRKQKVAQKIETKKSAREHLKEKNELKYQQHVSARQASAAPPVRGAAAAAAVVEKSGAGLSKALVQKLRDKEGAPAGDDLLSAFL